MNTPTTTAVIGHLRDQAPTAFAMLMIVAIALVARVA
jgi:hypothetical protein